MRLAQQVGPRVILAALDPAAGKHRVVLRMGRVHEVDRM